MAENRPHDARGAWLAASILSVTIAACGAPEDQEVSEIGEESAALAGDSAACNRFAVDLFGEYIHGSSSAAGDKRYPATLHGKTVRFWNGRAFNQTYAQVVNPSAGDIVSIDRTTDSDKQNTTQSIWNTSQIRGWEFCQTKAAESGGVANSPAMNNWHIPMRVCLRHNGALQCTNVWHADQT